MKVAPNEIQFASTWLGFSFSNLWRAYKIIVEIHTPQNSPHGFTVLPQFKEHYHSENLKFDIRHYSKLKIAYFNRNNPPNFS